VVCIYVQQVSATCATVSELIRFSLGTGEVVVDKGLGAGFDAGNPVAHGVKAGLGGVDLDDDLELGFAAFKLLLHVVALGLALFEKKGLGVFTVLEHLLHVAGLSNVGVETGFVNSVAWHKIVDKSSSHFTD
jgi:hypothetical protein